MEVKIGLSLECLWCCYCFVSTYMLFWSCHLVQSALSHQLHILWAMSHQLHILGAGGAAEPTSKHRPPGQGKRQWLVSSPASPKTEAVRQEVQPCFFRTSWIWGLHSYTACISSVCRVKGRGTNPYENPRWDKLLVARYQGKCLLHVRFRNSAFGSPCCAERTSISNVSLLLPKPRVCCYPAGPSVTLW